MTALPAGKTAPDVVLPDMHGKTFSLQEALQSGPAVLVFFKVTCPVCQYGMPFVERLYRAYKGKSQVIAVSQHPRKETQLFLKEYGITMPVLLDDPEHYPASNAYGLTHVPTIFLIGPDRNIEISSVGWNRADLEDMNRRLSEEAARALPPLFHRGESVIDAKSG
jgi:peroxiredoxin